ncbi:MAG: hypothetical protein ABSA12_05670 [Verrucomicrobiia bacterium]
MTKQLFNEPESYLLKNWAKAQLLADSMDAVRKKYAQVFDKILDSVQEEHPELDSRSIHITPNEGNVTIGKKTWPSMYVEWPSGLRIWDIRLENLASEDEEVPEAVVWFHPPKELRSQVNFQEVADDFKKEAEQLMTKAEFKRVYVESTKTYAYLSYPLPETRQKLLESLLADEAREFIECVRAHFESLTRFTSVMDGITKSGKRTR